MSTINDQLFITEIDATRRLNETRNLDLLQPVRKEHSKLKEVVESFRLKVDKLIDKQRQEYVQAYENHVQDVQKELHNLREKVYEIANDDTKNERTEKLTDDLQSYKNEAIKLEEDSDELRSVMARLVRKIYAAGNEFFWVSFYVQ
jgi:dsDNA-specific endonuclease/ATPase MutS2